MLGSVGQDESEAPGLLALMGYVGHFPVDLVSLRNQLLELDS
jgi:hypothetical protein